MRGRPYTRNADQEYAGAERSDAETVVETAENAVQETIGAEIRVGEAVGSKTGDEKTLGAEIEV